MAFAKHLVFRYSTISSLWRIDQSNDQVCHLTAISFPRLQ